MKQVAINNLVCLFLYYSKNDFITFDDEIMVFLRMCKNNCIEAAPWIVNLLLDVAIFKINIRQKQLFIY